MKVTTVIALVLLLLSCSTGKESNTHVDTINTNKDSVLTAETAEDSLQQTKNVDPYNIKIYITHFTPYCGGASPSREILNNQTQPQVNTQYLLINLGTGEKIKVSTDATGTLYLNLEQGKYAIREMYKNVSFQEFRANNYSASNDFQQEVEGIDCYQKWWKSNLGEFEILAGDEVQSIELSEQERCFVGNNPCLIYTGPHPP